MTCSAYIIFFSTLKNSLIYSANKYYSHRHGSTLFAVNEKEDFHAPFISLINHIGNIAEYFSLGIFTRICCLNSSNKMWK